MPADNPAIERVKMHKLQPFSGGINLYPEISGRLVLTVLVILVILAYKKQ
jgi:hypothetical protein